MNHSDFVLMTCEHASARLPDSVLSLFDRSAWQDHQIYDVGALDLASFLAENLGVNLLSGAYSRLLVDLNRSKEHPDQSVLLKSYPSDLLLQKTIAEYYESFRSQAEDYVLTHKPCIHLSIHSFTRQLGSEIRHTDCGVLFDPRSYSEEVFAKALIYQLRTKGLQTEANYPYLGIDDGHTTHLRGTYEASRYAGIEIEICNDLLISEKKHHLYDVILKSLLQCLSCDIF